MYSCVNWLFKIKNLSRKFYLVRARYKTYDEAEMARDAADFSSA